ncbi:MAG: DUF4401 domain-containing protein, partial [Fusobacteriaceae bacterium]
ATSFISNITFHYLNGIKNGLLICMIINTAIFTLAIREIRKRYSSTSLQRMVVNFFKINLIFYLLGSVTLLISLFGLRDISLFLVGIIFLVFSFLSPKIIKSIKGKNEVITFVAGIICITIYLSRILKFENIICFIIASCIYGFFYHFRYSESLDYLAIPYLTIGFASAMSDRELNSVTAILSISFLVIFLSFQERWSDRLIVKRWSRGGEITLLFLGTATAYDFLDSKIDSEILTLLSLLTSLVILKRLLRSEKNWKYLSLSIILTGVAYVFKSHWGINLAIMFILLYLEREEKYMLAMAVIFFAGQISFYYYKMGSTLLMKGYDMLKSSTLLFTGSLLLGRKR